MEYINIFYNYVIYLYICHFQVFTVSAVSCPRHMTDVLFMLDSSYSMHESQFDSQLKFVSNIVDHFEIGSEQVQVGILTFGHRVRVDFRLNSFHKKEVLMEAIGNISYLGGGTETGEAINFGRKHMFSEKFGGRKNANKIIIVITDGISDNQTKTESEARIAKLSGIHIIAVGVGNKPADSELRLIANDGSLFKVDNFDSLDTIVDSLSQQTCYDENVVQNDQNVPTASIASCRERPLDIFFVLDNSNSIWSENFKKVLRFVADLIALYDLTKTRVGIISYSDDVQLMLPLQNHLSLKEITKKIMDLEQLTGGTETGKAIRYLTSYGFSEIEERPEAAARVALIFTDGKSIHPKDTKLAAIDAKKQGIYLISIGIEENSDFQELKELASDPKEKFTFHVKDYNALETIKDSLVLNTCRVQADHQIKASDKNICHFPRPTAITFIYDSSAIGLYRSRVIRKSIVGVVKSIDFSDNNVQIGVLSKTCSKQKNVFFSDYKLRSEFINSLNTKESDGLTHLLRKFRIKYQKQHHNIERHRSIVVLFVDNDLTFPETAAKETRRTAFKSDVFVMSVGNNISKGQAEKLCSGERSHCLYHTEHYSQLPHSLLEMFEDICS